MRYNLNSVDDDLSFRDQVITNKKESVDFFLSVYSKPILEYVGKNIVKVAPSQVYDFTNKRFLDVYSIGVSGLYYEFIAAKFPKIGEENANIPQWNALRNYNGANDCRLFTYLNVITIRHFCNNPIKEDKARGITKGRGEVDEASFVDSDMLFQKLCDYLYDEDESLEFTQAIKEELDKAKHELREKTPKVGGINGERDYLVLSYSVVYEYESDVIAELLEEFLPRPIAEMKRSQIQTRLSQWKLRAIQHLTDIILDPKNKKKYPNVRGLINRHNNIKKNCER